MKYNLYDRSVLGRFHRAVLLTLFSQEDRARLASAGKGPVLEAARRALAREHVSWRDRTGLVRHYLEQAGPGTCSLRGLRRWRARTRIWDRSYDSNWEAADLQNRCAEWPWVFVLADPPVGPDGAPAWARVRRRAVLSRCSRPDCGGCRLYPAAIKTVRICRALRRLPRPFSVMGITESLPIALNSYGDLEPARLSMMYDDFLAASLQAIPGDPFFLPRKVGHVRLKSGGALGGCESLSLHGPSRAGERPRAALVRLVVAPADARAAISSGVGSRYSDLAQVRAWLPWARIDCEAECNWAGVQFGLEAFGHLWWDGALSAFEVAGAILARSESVRGVARTRTSTAWGCLYGGASSPGGDEAGRDSGGRRQRFARPGGIVTLEARSADRLRQAH